MVDRVNQVQYGKTSKQVTAPRRGREPGMRPAFVLLGFVLGSAAAITFSLTGVVIVFLVLAPEHPRLAAEIRPLMTHLALFIILTMSAGSSFYAEIKRPAWRALSLAGLAAALVGIVAFYSLR
jgi:uncharacterized membrane protein